MVSLYIFLYVILNLVIGSLEDSFTGSINMHTALYDKPSYKTSMVPSLKRVEQ